MNGIKEQWKPVPGYEGYYEVSNIGNVKRLKRTIKVKGKRKSYISTLPEKILRDNTYLQEENNYIYVDFCISGIPDRQAVHNVVAKCFIPNPLNKPEVNHINGKKNDNRVCNLEWVTRSENIKHTFRVGLNYVSHKHRLETSEYFSKPVYCYETDIIYKSRTQAIESLDISADMLTSLIHNKGIWINKGRKQDKKYHICNISDMEYLKDVCNRKEDKLFFNGRNVYEVNTDTVLFDVQDMYSILHIPVNSDPRHNNGYVPKCDMYFIDIGFNDNVSSEEKTVFKKRWYLERTNYIRNHFTYMIFYEENKQYYPSCVQCELANNLRRGCVSEAISRCNGYYKKMNIHFKKVHMSEVPDNELVDWVSYYISIMKGRNGGRK